MTISNNRYAPRFLLDESLLALDVVASDFSETRSMLEAVPAEQIEDCCVLS